MQRLTIDFETYYDKDYSLSKITTQEYLYSHLFEIIGVSVAVDDKAPKWFSGSMKEIKEWLEYFDWEHSLCVAHNAYFDGGILELVLGIHPKMYFCTMMGARPVCTPFTGRMSLANVSEYFKVGTKGGYVSQAIGMFRTSFTAAELYDYGTYCKNDVVLCRSIMDELVKSLTVPEMKMIDLHIKKYTRPKILLDKRLLEEELARVLLTKDVLLAEAGLDTRETLMSNPKFAAALRNLGVDPPMKISPRTSKETYAFAKTDQGMRDLVNHSDPDVQTLVAARLGHKSTIEVTRLGRFVTLAGIGKPLSVPLLYYGAHTGRSSGLDKLNLQNLNRGSKLRQAMVAPKGHKLVSGDLSQIEARLVACMAGQDDLVEQFRNGIDVYASFASDLYGHVVTSASHPDERFVGKVSILQLGFGAGDIKFHDSVTSYGADINELESARTVKAYRTRFQHIPKLWRTLNGAIKAMIVGTPMKVAPVSFTKNKVTLPNGMPIHYPELISGTDGYLYTYQGRASKKLFGAALLENIIQALARIILRDIELTISRYGYDAVLNIHDELIYCILDRKVAAFERLLNMIMTQQISWMPSLPVACEIHIGDNYAECK